MLQFDALAFEVVPPLGGVGSGLHKRAVPCRRAAVYNLTFSATKATPWLMKVPWPSAPGWPHETSLALDRIGPFY